MFGRKFLLSLTVFHSYNESTTTLLTGNPCGNARKHTTFPEVCEN